MKKITLIIMLLGAFTFGITSCGSNNSESKTEQKESDGHDHNHSKDDTTHHEGDGHKH